MIFYIPCIKTDCDKKLLIHVIIIFEGDFRVDANAALAAFLASSLGSMIS